MKNFPALVLTALPAWLLAWPCLAEMKLTPTPMDAATTSLAAKPASKVWDHKAYVKAWGQSGRWPPMNKQEFMKVQARKEKALKQVEARLKRRFGHADGEVLRAFSEVPREFFCYQWEKKFSFARQAYEIPAKTWAIGWGSALSDYLGQAYMVQMANPKPGDVCLEIGTGSGFNAALLSRLVSQSYSIEIIKPLGKGVRRLFKPLGYNNVKTRVGDGFFGWPEVKGGFDIIMVTCAAQYTPPALLKQLKKGGRLIIPIGQPFKHRQVLYMYTMDEQGKVHSKKYSNYYFIPMTGEIQKHKHKKK
jgi:protein-L-isoaspartate(D-aspartate) O-methyltransferase